MMKHVGGWIAAVGGVSLIVAACGGGEATKTPAPTVTTGPAATPTIALPRPSPTQSPLPTQPIGIPPTPAATVTQAPITGPQPKYGGTLNVRYYADHRRWDSWRADANFPYPFVKSMMSNIIQYKQGTFDIVGELAESWDVGGDGKTYTFRLRKDARWHDGTPVTAKDIVYNFQRGLDPQYTVNRARVAAVQSMETPDDSTFKAILKDRSHAFFPQVATGFMLMYPAHISEMALWQKSPVGSGPFKFGADKPNNVYEFVKSPNYFIKDGQGRTLPYLDGINFFVIPDQGLALSAMLTGRVHCGCTIAEQWLNRNENKIRAEIPGVKLERLLGALRQLYFNVKRPPFDNLAFRQAVAIGVDKAKIATVYAQGKNYQPAPALVPPEFGGQWGLSKAELEKVPGYNPNHSVDLRIMNEKIQQSGIDPKKVKLQLTTTPVFEDLADLVASHLTSDLGIETAVVLLQGTAEVQTTKQSGAYHIDLMSDNGAIDDPLDWYRDFISTGGSRNLGGYSNARFDDLLRIQDTEQDPVKRKQYITEMQRIELAEFPKAPYLWQYDIRGTWPEVVNFKAGPITLQNWDWSNIWLDKK